jgi:hypothetical protein
MTLGTSQTRIIYYLIPPLLRATTRISTMSSSEVGALPPEAHAPPANLYAAYRAVMVGTTGIGQSLTQ